MNLHYVTQICYLLEISSKALLNSLLRNVADQIVTTERDLFPTCTTKPLWQIVTDERDFGPTCATQSLGPGFDVLQNDFSSSA